MGGDTNVSPLFEKLLKADYIIAINRLWMLPCILAGFNIDPLAEAVVLIAVSQVNDVLWCASEIPLECSANVTGKLIS